MHHRKQLRIHGTSARRTLEALVVAVALLGGGDLSAQQTGQIAGQVTSEDGSPVVRATIRVPGENLQGTTATDGRFVIPRVPAGSYEVEIYALGYGDATQQVQVSAGGVGTLNVQLEVRPVEVLGVQVHVLRPDLRHTAQIEADAVRESNPRDVGDALRAIAGVDAVRRGPIGLDPSIRALRETQVGTYMNGTRLFPAGPARMDSPLTHLDPSAIQHIEVVKGPYALTWGAGNMAAIRIETRSVPPQIPGGLRGTLSAGYDTNLEAQEYSGTLFGSSERVAYWGHGVWRTGTDYETGSGDVIPADFDSWEARGQLGYRTGDASWLSFDMGYQKQGPIDYPGRLLSAKSFKTNNLAAEWELARAQGLLRNIDLLVYLNSVDHQMDNTDKPTRMAMEGRVPPFALDVLVDSHIDVTGGRAAIELVSEGGWDVEIGGDAYSAKRDADRFIDALDPNQMTPPLFPFHDRMWPDATITDVGLWTRADRPLANRLSLSAAVRLDLVSADAKDVSDTFLDYAGATRADVDASETNFNAAATLSANLGSNWSLSTGAGSVVRTADASERYGDRIPGTRAQLTTEFLGNPHLDPERSTQGDIWLEGRFPNLSLDANVFARRVSDYITIVPRDPAEVPFLLPLTGSLGNTNVVQYVNGEADFWGVEASVAYRWSERFSTTVVGEYLRGDDTELDEPAFGVAPVQGRLRLRYEESGAGYFLESLVTAVGKQDRLAVSRGEGTPTPGYATVDLQGGFQPYVGVQVRAGVNNALDKQYYDHLNAKNPFSRTPIAEPGRIFFIRLTYSY